MANNQILMKSSDSLLPGELLSERADKIHIHECGISKGQKPTVRRPSYLELEAQEKKKRVEGPIQMEGEPVN